MHISHNEKVICTSRGLQFKIFKHSDTNTHIFSRKFSNTISLIRCQKDFVLIGLFNGHLFLFNLETTDCTLLYKLSTRITSITNHGCFYYVSSEEGEVVVLYIRGEEIADYKHELSTSVFYDESATEELFSGFDSSIQRSDSDKSTMFENTDSELGTQSFDISTKDVHVFDSTQKTLLSGPNIQTKFFAALIRKFTHSSPVISLETDGEKVFLLDMRGKVTQYPDNIAYDICGTCMYFKKYLFVSENNRLFCLTEDAFACFLECVESIKSFWFSKNGGIVIIKHSDSLKIHNNSLDLINELDIKIERFVFDEPRNRIIAYDGFRIDIIENIVPQKDLLASKISDIVFSKSKIITKRIYQKDEVEKSTRFDDYVDSHTLVNSGTSKPDFKTKTSMPTDLRFAKKPNIFSNEKIDYIPTNNTQFKKSAIFPRNASITTMNEVEDDKSNKRSFEKTESKFAILDYSKKASAILDFKPDPALNKTSIDDSCVTKNELKDSRSNNKIKRKRYKSMFIDDAADDASSDEEESEINKQKDTDDVSVDFFQENPQTQLNNNHESSSDQEKLAHNDDFLKGTFQVPTIKPFLSGTIESPEAKLFCYNQYGYIIEYGDNVEAIFHDSETPIKTFNEEFIIGAIHKTACVFADHCKFYFYGETDWNADLENITLVAVNDLYAICSTPKKTLFYSHSGSLIVTLKLDSPISVATSGSNCVIYLQDRIIFITKFFETRIISGRFVSNFFALDDEHIYLGVDKKLYLMKNDLLVCIMKIIHNPVCIHQGYLICCEDKLFPAPQIIYSKITTGDRLSDSVLSTDMRVALYTINKADTNEHKTFIQKILSENGPQVNQYDVPHFREKQISHQYISNTQTNRMNKSYYNSVVNNYQSHKKENNNDIDFQGNIRNKYNRNEVQCVFDSHLNNNKENSDSFINLLDKNGESTDLSKKENIDVNILEKSKKLLRFNPFAKKK